MEHLRDLRSHSGVTISAMCQTSQMLLSASPYRIYAARDKMSIYIFPGRLPYHTLPLGSHQLFSSQAACKDHHRYRLAPSLAAALLDQVFQENQVHWAAMAHMSSRCV